ncbi:hypothetical protein KAI52_01480 [Candidatus Parcubacteria bacterium]|nr:hypothetical protein [Candidatus Parcubacteria bacterium]
MKKSNKILVGSLVVAMISALAVSSAMAYQGDYSKQGPAYSPERHTAMTKAMDSNDYQAWSDLMADRGRVRQVIKEDNFERFAEARRLGRAGDIAGADAIRQELGLRTSNGEKVGAKYGNGQGKNRGNRQESRGMNGENRGQNQGGKFIDADGDGNCDNL